MQEPNPRNNQSYDDLKDLINKLPDVITERF
jgi:hypothetical protein